jgi:pimeloyl-ACP methyl ester carboxylesterase
MYYEEAGSGEPLLLLGGLGSDLQAWALQAPVFSRHFRVVTCDNRGAGRSSAPDKPYTIAGMADDAGALLAHLGIESAHVIGWGMGGCVAQELALRHPGRVKKLILVNSAAALDGRGEHVLRTWVDIRRSNLSREQIVRFVALLHFSAALHEDRTRYEQAIENGVANAYPQQDHAFIRQSVALIAHDARERLKDIAAETLVVASTEDAVISPGLGKALAAGIPNAKLAELPGGHAGLVEHATEYNAAIFEFLGVTSPVVA